MAEQDEFLAPDDYKPRTPQDDLDWHDDDIDPIITEENEDATEILGETAEARREALANDEDPDDEQSEDYRELVEDSMDDPE
jgi:hypothetical protein